MRCPVRLLVPALAVLITSPTPAPAARRSAVTDLLLSAGDLSAIGDLSTIGDLTAPSRLGSWSGGASAPDAGLQASLGDLNKVATSDPAGQRKAGGLTRSGDLARLQDLLKLGDMTHIGDLFKVSDGPQAEEASRESVRSSSTYKMESDGQSKVSNSANVSALTEEDQPSRAPVLAEVSDLTAEVSDLPSGRTVGRSGRRLPAGLIKPSNPYETWSSYHGRVEADRSRRLARHRRAADSPHSRHKRFLSFPTGSILYIEPNVYLPVYRSRQLFQYIYAQYTMGWIIPRSLVVGRSAVDLARLYESAEGTMSSASKCSDMSAAYFLELPVKLRWKLPSNTNTSINLGLARDRGGVFEVARRALDKFGMDGRACLLRAICEVAAYPMEHEGLFGEIMNIVLSASRGPDDDSRLDPYLRAEYEGRAQGDCHATYAACPVSVFNLI
ncbi:hypothetical protein FJT64_023387 [Amphibalanus amphitrite]|uniref:Uncharacterized protein n=1 Tax=Amphibalanus amphitrite TaxID=1232801 RepID=A0A6A4WMG2_AMPAM|nr:hypothetical protein FJT64_023387 [Amphibalanus amphitrite]